MSEVIFILMPKRGGKSTILSKLKYDKVNWEWQKNVKWIILPSGKVAIPIYYK